MKNLLMNVAAKEATEIGKEAWRDAQRHHTSVVQEIEVKSRERLNRVTDELRETKNYLKEHPVRAVVLGVSAIGFAVAFVLNNRLKQRH